MLNILAILLAIIAFSDSAEAADKVRITYPTRGNIFVTFRWRKKRASFEMRVWKRRLFR